MLRFSESHAPGDQSNECVEGATVNHMVNTLYLHQAIISPIKTHTKHGLEFEDLTTTRSGTRHPQNLTTAQSGTRGP